MSRRRSASTRLHSPLQRWLNVAASMPAPSTLPCARRACRCEIPSIDSSLAAFAHGHDRTAPPPIARAGRSGTDDYLGRVTGRCLVGGDRATRGRGTGRSSDRHGTTRSSPGLFGGTGLARSELAESVPGGDGGNPARHEAITSAKASSSRSGSARTTAQNSPSNTGTVEIAPMPGVYTATGWRSSAVVEMT